MPHEDICEDSDIDGDFRVVRTSTLLKHMCVFLRENVITLLMSVTAKHIFGGNSSGEYVSNYFPLFRPNLYVAKALNSDFCRCRMPQVTTKVSS